MIVSTSPTLNYYVTFVLHCNGHTFCECEILLRWKTTVWVVGETNYVIYKFTFIDTNGHTSSLIHQHKSSMIINQTMVELYDIRYAQNYILDEDVM